MNQYLKRYYQENKERWVNWGKKYAQTQKGKACKQIGRHKRRARLKNIIRIPYTSSELLGHFDKFNSECVYCGSDKDLTADHVIPIAKSGTDSLDNILPCCLSCNTSKQHKDYLEWYLQSKHFCLERLVKIAEFIGDDRRNSDERLKNDI